MAKNRVRVMCYSAIPLTYLYVCMYTYLLNRYYNFKHENRTNVQKRESIMKKESSVVIQSLLLFLQCKESLK